MRYHSLDALRAAMMLLGVVLHSAASYTETPLGSAWPYHDARTTVVFDLIIFFIHLFRMPAFFVVAGFFAAFLYYRDGAARFVRNRAMRVGLPLPMFWAVVLPLTGFGFLVAARQSGGPMPWEHMPRQSVWEQPILGHLWFLYYLLLLYAATLLALPIASRLPYAVRAATDQVFRAVVVRPWGVGVLAIATMTTLLPMDAPGLDTSAALLPAARVLAAYAVFFAFGWLLFRNRGLIETFGTRWERMAAAGVATSAMYLAVVLSQRTTYPAVWHVSAVALAGLSTWLLIFGITGLFVRRMNAPHPLVRYVSDASYWMYLTHLAPITWTAGLLARSAAPAGVKFVIVLGVTTAVTLVTYHFFVRATAIGELLNGRRYPRALPRAAQAQAIAG